ncbi:MAG: DUF3638 domain-containing protein, partial [Verrucomicrobia bacterium]|nr:DUF3638 domain-containing protein [Verrucomicrobiota bacterium]
FVNDQKRTLWKDSANIAHAKSGGKEFSVVASNTEQVVLRRITSQNVGSINQAKIRETIKRGVLHILISPLLALIRQVTGKAKVAQSFIEEANCKNYAGFSSLLSTAERVVGSEHMRATSALAGRIQLAHSSKGESLQEIAESIVEDVNSGKTVNIPSGYYDDTNTFRPIILECSKGVIELYGSEPKEALRTTFTGDLNTKLLVRLLQRTQPPQAISQVAKKKISVFAGSSEQPSAVTSSQVSAFQALNTLITNEGFAVGQTVKLALAETSAQGLLWGLLEKTAIDAPQIAKAHFMLELMGEHLSTVIQKIGSFSDRDQVAILQALLTEYDQAKTLCEQEFGLKKGLDAVAGLADLDAIVQKVRSRLASLQLHLEKKASNRRDYDLQAASSVSRSTVQITPTEKKQTTPVAEDDSHDAKLKNLEQAIKSQNVQETIQALQTVAKSLDSLIESKQYAQVIAAATKALGYLPVPSSPYAADQNTLWAKVDPSDVTACQQALHDIVKLLWEAKLQNGDTHCSSNELVGMSLAEAAVLRLMLTRGIAAENRIIEKLIERKDDPKISLLLRRLGCYEESSEADFKQALLINTRDNACIRGLLCRELGLPFEICADSLYRFFPNSNSALTALLVTDRFALSYSKENHSKVALLRDFYDTPLWGGRGEQAGGKIGLYDQALAKCYGAYSSSLEVTDKTTEESITEALELYRDSKRSFIMRYENGKQVTTPMKEEYKLEELRSQLKSSVASLKGDEALLPATLEIQNALQVMSESMIYPESLLRLYDGLFEYKKDEKYTSRLNAIKEELEKVGKIDPKDAAWHRQIVQEGLSSMGRISVVPMDNDIVGDRGIGLRFPSEFHWRRFPKNPTNSEGEVGEVDSKLTEALVASDDKQHSHLSGIYSSDRSVRQEYTEEGTLASIAASENDPDMMYRLFSLRVAGENGDFHHSSALHALQFILDYPEKLNNPSIKRYVEATLFRPPLLLEASAQIPEAFKARLLQLEPLLDRAIKAEETELAAYLIHVGSSLEQFLGVPTVDNAKKTQLAKWLRDSLEPVTQKTIQFALYYLDRVRLKGFEAADKPLMMEAYKLLQATPLGSDIVALHKEVLDWMQMTISSDERLAARQANVAGMNTVIVPEIARHPDFMAVFGPRIFSGTINENSQTHITYKCRVEGKEFELAYDKRSQSLIIKQFVDGAWYRFCHVEAPNAAHTDICLSHYNCWVDDGNKNAFVFLDDQIDWHPENRIKATLTSKGHFDSLRIGDKLLGFDSKGEKTRWLSCFHPSRILLEKDAKGKVAAIRILGTDIVLEKQNSIWQQHGFEWVAPSDAEILQPATRNLLKHIGKAVDDVAVVLKGKEADKVLIVPHVITGVVKEVETSQVTLEFEKEDISEVLVKPLEVSIENGRVETSCAGFLYLAELAACQKNLKQALFYLEEASKRTLLPEDAKTFTQVAASLDVLPANTLRSAAFKLKAYLFVSHLQRSYMAHSGLQVGREQEFVSSARKITALYRQYTAAYGSKNRIPKELELTTAELAECNHIANEALEDLVKATPSKPITRPAAEEIGALMPYLAVFAQAAKGPLGLPPKPDLSLLGRFTEYYDLAKNKKEITQQDIDQLFTAVSSSYTADVQKAIDTARRILHIAFNENDANQNDANQNSASFVPDKEPFVPGKFHADLLSLQKWLPKKEVKSPLQALLAVPSMKKIADLQRRFADEFPAGQMQEGAQELEETVQLTSQVVAQREKELRARIEERKSSLQGALESRATGAIKVEPNSWLAVVDLPSHFKAASRERRGEISERQRATYFPDTIEASDPMHAMKAEENALQQEGICAAVGDFEREQSDRVLLTNKSELQDQVVARLAILSLEVSELGEKIQELVLLAKKDNPEIRELLRNRAMFGQEQFLERLFKIYQKQQGTGNQKLDNAITSFLIKGVEQIHLEKARERLKNYNDVHADKVVLASEIKQLLETATKHDRYNDKEPAIARKYLVAEFTRGIVLRPGQILAIEEIRQNPNRLMQLRMGLGKTSYILPIAMQILAEEKGLLPIALVPQGLFAMNRRDMDATTRKLFQQAAYELRVTDDVLSNSMLLAQELDRLYEVKQNKGYIIASIEQIAAIEHALTQCDEQLGNKPSVELENRRQWLCQIRALLQDKGTQFFADEADEVFSINKEINIALPGGDRSPDEVIVEAGQKLILHILETDHTQPSLQMLKKALLEGKQASLPKTLLHEAVGELRAFSASQDGVVKIAIQKMLAGPFIDILQRNPEVDYGFLSASGCTTGPRSEKKEKPNMKFGDEYELVLYNVINYINKAPSREFLVSTIRSLRLNNQERYHALQELAGVAGKSPQESMEAIIAYLEKGENWKARLEILDKDVLREGLVTFSKEQLIL